MVSGKERLLALASNLLVLKKKYSYGWCQCSFFRIFNVNCDNGSIALGLNKKSL